MSAAITAAAIAVTAPAGGGVLTWTAIRLDEIRTSVLAGLDLRRAPSQAIAAWLRTELAARAGEQHTDDRHTDDRRHTT